MSRWYRAYEGTVSDAKLAEVALIVGCSRSVVVATWHAMLENAATVNDGGRIDIPSRRVAAILCEPFDTIESVFAGFECVGLLVDSHIAAWKKRQYESDNSTERSRKSREASREREATSPQQECNVASPLRDNKETSPSVYVSVSDSRVASEKITDEFEIWYAAYPRHVGRGAALRGYKTARTKADPELLLRAATLYASKCKGMDQKFIPHAATWLNQERWLDEDLQPPKPPPENTRVYVKYGTEAGDAWEAHYRAMGKVPPRDQHGGWWFDSETPPPIVQRGTSDAATAHPATSEAA